MKVLLALAFFLPSFAEARVFDLGREQFASYILLTGGPSVVKDKAFAGESSADTYPAGVAQNISGEFGFVYATRYLSWRFGFEILKPATMKSAAASQGGTDVYEVKSDLIGYIPKVGLEFNLKTSSWYRLLLFAGVGSASLTATNDYTSVTIAPNADFQAQYKSAGNLQVAGLAMEMAAFDTTSVVLELGYRKLNFGKLTYAKDVTGFGGAHAAGDTVVDTDGEKRQLDFSGGYAGLGLRFWLF